MAMPETPPTAREVAGDSFRAPAGDSARLTPQALTTFAKTRALDLGFALAGVAPADPPPHASFFEEWLRNGRHAEMSWLERTREKRSDPARVLPGARAILVVAMPYDGSPSAPPRPPGAGTAGADALADAHADPSGASGRVSSYARGIDYHDVMGRRLETLLEEIRDRSDPPCEGMWYVDTGPVLERDLAARAGIGWIGKNTMLLHPREGSWLFLGEILLTAPLLPDLPAADRCGSCTRCMDACPTDAFPAPYLLDSTRCIGYLTVELRGAIPRSERHAVGDRVFGCDDCQDVCPWNRKVARAPSPLDGPADMALPPLFELDDAGFRARFRRTALSRAKRRGLLRNAAVVLGNVGGPGAVPALTKGLSDPEPLVRAHAGWALGEIGTPEALETLARALEREGDPSVREELVLALDRVAPVESRPANARRAEDSP